MIKKIIGGTSQSGLTYVDEEGNIWRQRISLYTKASDDIAPTGFPLSQIELPNFSDILNDSFDPYTSEIGDRLEL